MPPCYRGHPGYIHGIPDRAGILLVNLGTPSAPDSPAVRRYLAQFLRDPRVVELPRLLWLPILYGIVLPLRSPRSAKAYRTVWSAEGSPLAAGSQRLAQAVSAAVNQAGGQLEVALAMRYGEPSIASVLRKLDANGSLRRLLVLPLYPQYSATTTASVFDTVADELKTWRWVPELRFVTGYYSEPAWLDAVADSVRAYWSEHGRGERLLFSFHGLPKRYFMAGDPYFCQCHFSARAIAQRLELAPSEWLLSFQSRVGREEWLRPYTEQILPALAKEGVRQIDVVCPGFAVDCLETLEEIALRNAGSFAAAGGQKLRYIPCLNDSPVHAAALAGIIRSKISDWPELGGAEEQMRAKAEFSARRARYENFRHE